MGTLVLLRHAKSGYPPGVDDHDRPLSGRGRRDALRAGTLLAELADPDLVLVSSARRARETWERVGRSVRSAAAEVRGDLYLAPAAELLETVRGLPADARTVVMVGHNEGLEDLASALSGEPTVLKTATFAVLTGDAPWTHWQPACARRDRLVVARAGPSG
jgi:phosphohistidine phosphatase